MNFILIGIPNSGKTTLGEKAAAALGMRFYDTDAAASERIYSQYRSPSYSQFLHAFRAAEEAAVREIAGKAENAVISTGSETALSKNNVQALRQSGRFIHIKRNPDLIRKDLVENFIPNPKKPEETREKNELMIQIYMNMLPEYEKLADFTVENDGDEAAGLAKLVKIIWAEPGDEAP
jgi:shikimate kinase